MIGHFGDHVLILSDVRTRLGTKGSLYYYAGNFFYPFLSLHGSEVGRVKRAIREFSKQNKDMILADRAKPEYMTLVELFDLEPY